MFDASLFHLEALLTGLFFFLPSSLLFLFPLFFFCLGSKPVTHGIRIAAALISRLFWQRSQSVVKTGWDLRWRRRRRWWWWWGPARIRQSHAGWWRQASMMCRHGWSKTGRQCRCSYGIVHDLGRKSRNCQRRLEVMCDPRAEIRM